MSSSDYLLLENDMMDFYYVNWKPARENRKIKALTAFEREKFHDKENKTIWARTFLYLELHNFIVRYNNKMYQSLY